MRGPWRDLLLLVLGIALGYAIAVITKAGNVPFLQPVRAYIASHQMEVFVGLALLGIIVYLAGGQGSRRR